MAPEVETIFQDSLDFCCLLLFALWQFIPLCISKYHSYHISAQHLFIIRSIGSMTVLLTAIWSPVRKVTALHFTKSQDLPGGLENLHFCKSNKLYPIYMLQGLEQSQTTSKDERHYQLCPYLVQPSQS